MKRFLAILLTAILIVSLTGVITASAGTSISGSSTVEAGKTYTYTASMSYTGFDMFGTVSCSGIFSGSSVTFNKGTGGDTNTSLSTSVTISVSVSSSAQPGDTGKISMSGQLSSVDAEYNVSESGISGSKTATVGTPATAAPKRTRDPNATPKPTETPEGWSLLDINIDEADEGTEIEFSMEDDTLLPVFVLQSLIEKKGSLTLDFGGYKVTIDSADLQDFSAETLDLGVEMEKDEELSKAAGGKDVYQLHFNHSGQLPGKFTYSFKAQGKNPGDILYLYYYYGEAGVLEGKAEAVVDENGFVEFVIYHCSSYFVTSEILEDATNNFTAVVEEPVMVEPEPTPSPTPEPVATPEPVEEAVAEVPESSGVSIVALIIALIATALLSITLTIFIGRAIKSKRVSKRQMRNSL